VTERLDYALKAVLLLAQHNGAYLTTQLIADEYELSSKMLATVLPGLCDAGLLTSRAGWHGGFTLALPPSEITVASIVQATLGQRVFAGAGLGPGAASATSDLVGLITVSATGDATDAFWRHLDAHVQEKLSSVTVEQLLTGEL
jgi:DNA-binding IscR family transcriptional regulator